MCLTHLDKAICSPRRVYTGVSSCMNTHRCPRGGAITHHRVACVVVPGAPQLADNKEKSRHHSQMMRSPSHVLLTWTGQTRQKARSLAAVAWLPLDCRAPPGATPSESSQSPTVPATLQIFLRVHGGRSADIGCKAVEVGVGSFSGLSPAKSPLEAFFFSPLSILLHRALVLALLQPSGNFQPLQKGCCAVCLPTFRFPGLSGLLLSNTMSSLVLGVLRNLDLSNSYTWPLSMKLGTEYMSLFSPTMSPGVPLIFWGT